MDAYKRSGVDSSAAQGGLSRLGRHVKATLGLRAGLGGEPIRGLGYYANVLDLGAGQGLALCTDGVGTKILVAEATGRYDTIGIDCIAMNVNDLICVGADPLALLDYIAVGRVDPEVFAALGEGLEAGCRACRITIPGGEIAQVRDMLRGEGPTQGLDLVGTAVGTVPLDRVLFGERVRPGDLVIGLPSSGLHSNGFTLARKVLAPTGREYDRHVPELGRTVADELLEPTALYVEFARALFASGAELSALCHVTGDGFVNLTRVEAPIGFVLDALPEIPPVFRVIAEKGNVSAAEMHTVFNMGVGLVVVAPPASESTVLETARAHGFASARVIGRVSDEDGAVHLPQRGLRAKDGKLVPTAS